MSNNIRHNVSLAPYTTLKVGGAARYVVEVTSLDELRAALQFAQQTTEAPPLLLGGGSNVLIPDAGYDGLVIINMLTGCEYVEKEDSVHVRVGAGMVLDDLIADTASRGLWGLENLSAIPGSVGATPIQNVGAYGVEVSDRIVSVEAIHRETLERKVFTHTDCEFAYRDSYFKTTAGRAWIITEVTFKLSSVPNPILAYKDLQHLTAETLTPDQVRTEVQLIRSKKFPDWTKTGTAGSFFKNPIIDASQAQALAEKFPGLPAYPHSDTKTKVALGWILDKVCGLRGYAQGNVALYENQALVLVAQPGATAAEIDEFARRVAQEVHAKTDIDIEWEVTRI